MAQVIDFIQGMAGAALRVWANPVNSGRMVAIVLTFILWIVARRIESRKWPHLGSRDMITDSLWSAFYVGGFFSVGLALPIYLVGLALIHRFAPFLELNLIAKQPVVVQVIVTSIVMDFTSYWWHRLGHTPLLWNFHRVHHSQTELTPLTTYRQHFGDAAVRSIISILPGVILGASATYYVAVIWIEATLTLVAHANVGWTYGPLGRFVISPQFHRIHHADDPRFFNANYAVFWTFWDQLFGTANFAKERPAAFGISEPVPRSFFLQLIDPFVTIARRLRGRPAVDAVAAAATSN